MRERDLSGEGVYFFLPEILYLMFLTDFLKQLFPGGQRRFRFRAGMRGCGVFSKLESAVFTNKKIEIDRL